MKFQTRLNRFLRTHKIESSGTLPLYKARVEGIVDSLARRGLDYSTIFYIKDKVAHKLGLDKLEEERQELMKQKGIPTKTRNTRQTPESSGNH